jgi:LmbE family N-acetylglucosaminyl deacetylase
MRALLFLLLAAILAGTAFRLWPANLQPPPPAGFPAIDGSTSLLVVAPHPDDEVLCCAGVIQRVLAAGGRVSVVWVTSGDASELDLLLVEKSLFLNPQKLRDLAGKRMQEARDATASLGVAAQGLTFLGYPDRGVLPLLTDHYTVPLYSKFNGSSAVPYDAALSPGHLYTGESLERDFDAVLARARPTLVLAPSPRDAHPDHEGAGILTMRALSKVGYQGKLRYWIVHGGETWPLPRGYHPQLALTPPPRGKGLSPAAFQLTATQEAKKLAALKLYRTQMEVMSSVLLSYVRTTELFSELPMPPPPPAH